MAKKTTKVLLTSEEFVKNQTNISDNVAGKYILTAIREAQDIGLQRAIGGPLFRKLKELVDTETIDNEGNEAYSDLLTLAQYYLAYQAVAEVLPKLSYKVTNAGVVKTSDEQVTNVNLEELSNQLNIYRTKAAHYLRDVQRFCLNNRAALPELNDCQCQDIAAHLETQYTGGLYLGGARGKILP